MILYEDLTQAVIGAAMEVHKATGAGLLESSYEAMLRHELTLRGLAFRKQVKLPLRYKGIHLDCGYRIDLIVEEKIIIEIKAVDKMLPVFEAQLMTYLKLSGYRVGLLINFNVPVLKDGITRRVL
jgi:GxxExxY protein